MTIDSACKAPPLSRSEQKLVSQMDQFTENYQLLIEKGKKNAVSAFLSLCKKAEKKPTLYKKIAHVYLKLRPVEQILCLENPFVKMRSLVANRLNIAIPRCFPPLLLLADECILMPLSPSSKQMDPLYRTLLIALQSTCENKKEMATFFNQLIEGNPPSHHLRKISLVEFDPVRSDHIIRRQICALNTPPFSFAGTTTHQRICADGMTMESDPYADDGAAIELRLENETLRLVSISDGGGKGESVVRTARLVNRLFLDALVANAFHIASPNDAANLLLQTVFQTQRALRHEIQVQHATHAALLSVFTDRNEQFGAVSLLGDTTAYLLIETPDALHIEKLGAPVSSKHTSHTNGDFSSTGDYSSLTISTFQLPKGCKSCMILGTDGLGDNFDPRNTLKPPLAAIIDPLPNEYYQERHIPFLGKNLSVSDALMNAHDQKDPAIYDATHLYPTPWALQEELIEQKIPATENLSIDVSQTWNELKAHAPDQLALLIDLYAQAKIRAIYCASTPETFAAALVQEARSNGKSDDILASATWLN